MKTIVALTVTAVLLAGSAKPAVAHAERVGTVTTAKASLAQSRVPLPPHLTIIHDAAPCNAGAAAGAGEFEVDACAAGEIVYLAPGADRFNRWHETGHVFDYEVLTETDRARFTRLLDFAPGSWERGFEETGEVTFMAGTLTPSEHFADAYAACALGLDPNSHWIDGYGYEPTARQHRRVCRAIRRLG